MTPRGAMAHGSTGEGAESTTTVWIGAANVTATTHYDAFHNSYVQLYGVKRYAELCAL